jgi:acyl-CoA thioesterase-1
MFFYGCSRDKEKEETAPSYQRTPPAIEASEDHRPVVVALGDSLTSGQGVDPEFNYPSRLQRMIDEEGYSYRVVNYGVSGDTSAQGLNRLQSVLELKPAIVIVELGANDGLRGMPAQVTQKNLAEIVNRLKSRNVRVVLAGMQVPPNYGPLYAGAFKNIFSDIARKYDVALIPFFLKGVGGISALNQDDGIHPTAEGYAIVTENVWKVLQPLL